jgi:RimJ/RimL family protein N-acetyltransferase
MIVITGKKIVLREYQAEDAEALLMGAHDPVIRRLTGTHATFTLEQTQRYIANYAEAEDRAGFVIAKPETLEPLGEVVILEIDKENRNAHIRITLFTVDDLNKGYGGEAMRLMVDYGFRALNLHRIGLDVFSFNERAVHVYEKIGFKREGVERDSLFYDGEFHDTILMGILEDEWPGSV